MCTHPNPDGPWICLVEGILVRRVLTNMMDPRMPFWWDLRCVVVVLLHVDPAVTTCGM